MHQDALWKHGKDDDYTDNGYWGVPPWIKHELSRHRTPNVSFPWPIDEVTRGNWFCAYLSEEVGEGFQVTK
jgi:hypothetical protein